MRLFLFCLCNLSETKLKTLRLISSSVVISKQSSVESVIRLLLITLMQIYGEKEKSGNKETQNNVQFEEKQYTEK